MSEPKTLGDKCQEAVWLPFVTRHEPAPVQEALARRMGYAGLKPVNVIFGLDPLSDLSGAGLVPPGEVAVVAPGRVILTMLRAGFSVIEFENCPEARDQGDFSCTGAWRLTLDGMEYFAAADEGRRSDENGVLRDGA